MIVVTGGAGFIGSCVLAELNALGRKDILVVDHLGANEKKQRNLDQKSYHRFIDKQEFLDEVCSDRIEEPVDAVIHMGACSSTTLTDRAYYMSNNFEYSCRLAEWAVAKGIRFIYASSAATYGDGSQGYSDQDDVSRTLKPLNFYGESKQLFDLWVLDRNLQEQVVGLKFFNVFGPNEYHKGDMRSVVAKAYARAQSEGRISLFKSYRPDYADGEQKRDFIYVKDVVDVIMFSMTHPGLNGIFNVGTGQARTWNDLAAALFAALDQPLQIDYVDMPESLRPQYQYFTEAEMSKLRYAGYNKPFTSLENAVREYAGYLKTEEIW